MAELASTAWYRLGTVSVADGSTKVTGNGTKFLTAGINPGAAFRIDNRYYVWEIKRVVSDTELELAVPYYGGTVSNASYSIDRNHQSTLPAILAARLAKAMGNWEERYDTDMQTITGKSAYEVAVEHGYSGTETQWLESLKAANEWSTLNDRTNILTYNNAAAHNSICRGKNLGTAITAAQMQAIRNGTFADLYVGDYWELPIDGGTTALIVGCNTFCTTVNAPAQGDPIYIPNKNLCVWLRNDNWKFPINDTDTCAGHLKGSKLYNETFPALVAKLEAVLPSGSLRESTHLIADSINANGIRNHSVIDKMKLFLPSRHNLALKYAGNYSQASDNSAYDGPNQIMWPYSLFKKSPDWTFFWMDAPFSATQWCTSFDCRWIDAMPAKASIAHTMWPYCYIG